MHPASLLLVGLVQHDSGHGGFDGRRIVLDRMSFDITGRNGLDAWLDRL
jgi:hypothetical protein